MTRSQLLRHALLPSLLLGLTVAEAAARGASGAPGTTPGSVTRPAAPREFTVTVVGLDVAGSPDEAQLRAIAAAARGNYVAISELDKLSSTLRQVVAEAGVSMAPSVSASVAPASPSLAGVHRADASPAAIAAALLSGAAMALLASLPLLAWVVRSRRRSGLQPARPPSENSPVLRYG